MTLAFLALIMNLHLVVKLNLINVESPGPVKNKKVYRAEFIKILFSIHEV